MVRKLIKITKTTALLSSLLLCVGTNAAVKNYENTWFEIEVILFSQLGDKSLLQEAFPDTSKIDTPKKIIDLLGPYLTLDIAPLKNRLPLCNDYLQDNSNSFASKAIEISYIPIETALTTKYLDNLLFINGLTFNDIHKNTFNEYIQNKSLHDQKNNFDSSSVQNNVNTTNNRSISNENVINVKNVASTPLKNKSVATEYVFPSFNIPQEFCVIPESFFNEYKRENPYFIYNNIPLYSTPLNISGEEDLSTEQPYLINQGSLQLHDIVKQLKRSRNFRPLMHMGWRQITQSKKNAASLKLYAGENLMQPYYEKLLQYNNQQKQLSAEQLIFNQALTEQIQNEQDLSQQKTIHLTPNELMLSSNSLQGSLALNAQQEVLESKISDILEKAKTSQHTLDSVLDNLNNNVADLVTPLAEVQETVQGNTYKVQLPTMPPQAWSIDGFITVEVGHFLHVTADFNIINMSLAEQATRQLVNSEQIPLKSIRFEQNKRVRSKEIHYFDHPYMGMIVQIRRHKQVPIVEEVDDILSNTETLN